MRSTADYVEKYVVLALRYYFGAHTFISGTNHYLLFFPDPLPIKPGVNGRFMQALVDSHMYDLSRAIEILSGFALLSGLFVPLALMFEMPVTMIIFYFNVVMVGTPRIAFTGWREVTLNLFLLASYWGYFKVFFMNPFLPLKPLWRDSFRSSKTEVGL